MATLELLPMPNGTVPAQHLDPNHFQALDTAMKNLLSLDISRDTLAQLFDGIPTTSVLFEARGVRNFNDAPILEHETLCDGAMDRAKAFIAAFDLSALQFDPVILQAFQNAALETELFKIRLLELVARTIHCVASSIDKLAEKSHNGNIREAIEYVDPPRTSSDPDDDGSSEDEDEFPGLPAFGHLFFSCWYLHFENYPFGSSDMAGYWAEDRIFGGVVLFDRGESGKEAKSVWFHSGRHEWTKRIWKPLNWQWNSMTDFLLNGPREEKNNEPVKWEAGLSSEVKARMQKQWKSEFPYFCDIDNPVRHDSHPSMSQYNIYRDKWERDISRDRTSEGPLNEFDYPEARVVLNVLLNASGMYHHQPDGTVEDTPENDDPESLIIGTFDQDGFQYAEHNKSRLTKSEMERGPFQLPEKPVSETQESVDGGSDFDFSDPLRPF